MDSTIYILVEKIAEGDTSSWGVLITLIAAAIFRILKKKFHFF
jgi:hypothetical protein